MVGLVSIGIPTYKRPEMLRQAIESCLDQTYKNIEIVVCDDSPDLRSQHVIESLNRPDIIRYSRNETTLGQPDNVNRLFDLAIGKRFVLLHDDDLLLPRAIELLDACWNQESGLDAVYGKQYFISAAGEVLAEETEAWNQDYRRTPEYAGVQSLLWAVLSFQFPNDGYMVKTEAARQIRYRHDPDIGYACDIDFNLRFASRFERCYYLDEFASMYRWSENSVSRVNSVGINYNHHTYRLIESLSVPSDLEPIRSDRLQYFSCSAIDRWIELNEKQAAFRIYMSKHYPLNRRLSRYGLFQALLMASPFPVDPTIVEAIKSLWKSFRKLNVQT